MDSKASRPAVSGTVHTSLHGAWLTAARVGWIVLVTFVVAIFVISLPTFLARLYGEAPTLNRQVASYGLSESFVNFILLNHVAISVGTMMVFVAVAVILFWRRSDDWMVLLTGLALVAFGAAVTPVVQAALLTRGGLGQLAVTALGYGLFLVFLYLFPDGRFVPRWTQLLAAVWVAWVTMWLVVPAANPFTWSTTLALVPLMAGLGTGLAAQLYRYYQVSTPQQRQQTKWVVFGSAIPFAMWVVVNLPTFLGPYLVVPGGIAYMIFGLLAEPLLGLSLLVIPVTIGLSVLRFRLWDVDVLIHRTLVYGALTLILGLFYVISVVVLQRVFRTLTGQTSDLAIVYSTLAIALVFMPLRGRMQNIIDRRFYRRHYDATKTLASFGDRVRNVVDLGILAGDLLQVVQNTMEPTFVSLWLRDVADSRASGGYRLRAQYPRGALAVWDIQADDPLIDRLRDTGAAIQPERLEVESMALLALEVADVDLMVPLVSQSELVGLLALGPRLSYHEYTADDRRLLSNLATQAAPAVRVAQLVRQQQAEVRLRERLEHELRVARLIQQTLLPDDVPVLPGWELATYYRPARAVGGDFYDFIPLSDGRLALIVGDVADKGMPAALMMASTRSFLRATAQRLGSPAEVLAHVNDLVHPDMPANMFVTCLYAILDPASGRFVYANAGQTLPYRRHNGAVAELDATGVPLGVVGGTRYEENETTLEPGEMLLFYSDGVVEAHNPQRDMFSFGRLESLMGRYPESEVLIDFLLAELIAFTGDDWEQEDDVTLLTLRRT